MLSSLRMLAAATAVLTAGIPAASAALTLYSPVGFSSSNEFGAGYETANLFDAAISEADIDQPPSVITGSVTSNFGRSWAVQGFRNEAVLVLDLGSVLSLDGFLYAQRTFEGGTNDDFRAIDLWFQDTDPGIASTALPPTLGTPDATFPLAIDDLALRRYDFGSTLTGRYAILHFQETDNAGGNPGGQELRFFAVPEPATALLALFLVTPCFLRRRSR